MSDASSRRRSERLYFRFGVHVSSPRTSLQSLSSNASASGKRNKVPPRLTNSLSPLPEVRTTRDIFQPTYAYSSTSSINCGNSSLSTSSRQLHQTNKGAQTTTSPRRLNDHTRIQSVTEFERNHRHSSSVPVRNGEPDKNIRTPLVDDSSSCSYNKVKIK